MLFELLCLRTVFYKLTLTQPLWQYKACIKGMSRRESWVKIYTKTSRKTHKTNYVLRQHHKKV